MISRSELNKLVTFDIIEPNYVITTRRTMTIPKSFIVGVQTVGDTLYLMMKGGRNEPVNGRHYDEIMAILRELYD